MEEHSRILFPACTVYKNKMYYVTHGERALKSVDLETGVVKYIDSPKGYDLTEWRGIGRLILREDVLYLFEENGMRMLEYSLLKNTARCFKIDCDQYLFDVIAAAEFYEDKIYIFPSFANRLVRIDLKSGQVESRERLCPDEKYIVDLEDRIILDEKNDMPMKLFVCGCRIGDLLWIFSKKYVVRYDLSTELFQKYILSDMINMCIYAVWKNEMFYILSIDGSIYTWEPKSNETEIIYVNTVVSTCLYFSEIVVTEKNIWMIPCFGDDIYIIDLETKKRTIYDLYPEEFKYYEIEGRSKYSGHFEDDKKCYFAMHSSNYILIINKTDGKAEWLKPQQPTWEEKVGYCRKNQVFWNLTEEEFGIDGLLQISGGGGSEGEKKGNEKKIGNLLWRREKYDL